MSDEFPNESKYWTLVIHDLSDEQLEHLKNLDCKYIAIGNVEFGDIKKAPHYHCMIIFDRSVRKQFVTNKTILNKNVGYYLEPKYKKSSPLSLYEYITKSGILFEKGNCKELIEKENKENKKKTSTQEIYRERIERAKAQEWDWFIENDAKFTLSNEYSKLEAKYHKQFRTEKVRRLKKLSNYWIYGRSKTGKSSSVEYLFDWNNVFVKLLSNEKWDDYTDQKIVLIDELNSIKSLDKGLEGLDGFKNKTSYNPFAVRSNYAATTRMVRPESFIICSNYTPSQLMSKYNTASREPIDVEGELDCIYNRFKVIHINDWLRLNQIKYNPRINDFEYYDYEGPLMCKEDKNILN